MEDPDKIPDEQIEKEIKEITNKHDKKLLNRLSSMKDLNKLVSSTPLKVEKPIENGENLPKIEIEEANSPSDEFRMNKFRYQVAPFWHNYFHWSVYNPFQIVKCLNFFKLSHEGLESAKGQNF